MSFEDLDYLEQVYAALFAKLQAAQFAGSFQIARTTRAVIAPDSMPVADQPALVMVPGPFEVVQREVYGPTKARLTAMAFVYWRRDGTTPLVDDPLTAQRVNFVMWGIVQSLWPTNRADKQTLGGVAYHCWVEGDLNFEVVEEQLILGVPIHILI